MFGKEESKDYDTWYSKNLGIPYALYLYYLDNARFTDDNISILGNCSAIQSVQYTPFLEPASLNLFRIPYDVDRFGKIDKLRPAVDTKPDVFRIVDVVEKTRIIGKFETYTLSGLTIGGEKNWRNESRLYNYPYSFAMLTDHLNTPLTIKYHLCPKLFEQYVGVNVSISDRCSYGLYIKGYKGDNLGNMEALVSGDAHELPCSSSAYSQWFASSKNQTRFNAQQSMRESFLQQAQVNQSADLQNNVAMINGVMGGVASLLGGNIMGAVSSAVGVGTTFAQTNLARSQASQSGALHRQGITGSLLAQQRDLESTPNTLISMGSDIIYGLQKGEKRVQLFRYGLTEEYYKRLGDYFHMYGYKQNKLMRINLRNRYYFNYIKTVGVNLRSLGIPREHFNKLMQIYNNGTTIWHIDREGVNVGNYTRDNYEV